MKKMEETAEFERSLGRVDPRLLLLRWLKGMDTARQIIRENGGLPS